MKRIFIIYICLHIVIAAQPADKEFRKEQIPAENFIESVKKRHYYDIDKLRKQTDEGFYVPILVYFYVKEQLGLVNMKDTLIYNESGDITYRETLKQDGGDWIMTGNEVYEYGPKGRIAAFSETYYNGERWILNREVFTYDDKDSLARMEAYSGEPGDLTPSYKQEYIRDSLGRKREEIFSGWTNQWVNSVKQTYEYDSSGRLEEYSYNLWGETDWLLRIREFYVYFPDGRTDYRISNLYNFSEESLLSTSKADYLYDDEGFLMSEHYYYPDDSLWVLTGRNEYIRDGSGRLLSREWVSLEDTLWINVERYTYAYDDQGNMTSEIYEYGVNTEWRNIKKTLYDYDSVNNPVHGEYFGWENGSWLERNGSLYIVREYYAQSLDAEYAFIPDGTVGVENENLQPFVFSLDQNYPNPFNPETKISFSLPQSGKASLKVYDMLGREVTELVNGEMEKGTHSVNFNGRNLSSGIYIYRLQSGNFTESKKMALIK
jgi:hypothetical protein